MAGMIFLTLKLHAYVQSKIKWLAAVEGFVIVDSVQDTPRIKPGPIGWHAIVLTIAL